MLAGAAVLAITICTAPVSTKAADASYVNDVYRQLGTEKSNTADFTYAGEKVSGYDLLSDLVKMDDKDNLFDGAMLRNRGNWVVLKQGNTYKLIAENAYDVDKADQITTEIADEIRKTAGDGATDRELFYEYLRYMEKNFHYSKEVSKNTQLMNSNHVIVDTDNFTDSYYTLWQISLAPNASLLRIQTIFTMR